MNSIHTIHPYRLGNTWVFDDDRVDLFQEAFVGGMSEIIDMLTEYNPKDHKGFTLLFSEIPFKGHTWEFNWVREECGGNTYSWNEMEGWLCPALFLYFPQAPKKIYAQKA